MFDTIIDRRGTDSAKWHRYAGRDIIPMWVADMDFRSPQPILDALQSRIDHGVFGYGIPTQQLTQTVCDHIANTYQWAIEPRWIVWLPGLVSGLNAVCLSVGSPSDGILTTVPVYPPFLTAPQNTGRNLLTTRMRADSGRWGIDWQDLEQRCAQRPALFILCNPHNPTGRVLTPEELTKLADICQRHDMVICSDEIHCDLILEKECRHIPIASMAPEIAERTITLMAPSKTFNIPGLSCSFAIVSNGRLRRNLKQAMRGIVPHTNVLGMTATQAAYAQCMPWLEDLRRYLAKGRDVVMDAVASMPGLSMHSIEATYLAWIDTRALGVKNVVGFFENAGVGLSDGKEFDGEGHVRLNFGCPHAVLMDGLERMDRAIEQL